jgi:rhamnulokinase
MTNEGGVAGTFRFLRNVMGLWLVQEARRALARDGTPPSYAELTELAERAPPFTAFIDPDNERFLRPGDLPATVAAFCRETEQPAPVDAGTLVRVLLESLALKYAWVVDQLSSLTNRKLASMYVVGGGARNGLLCRLTAAATGLPVRAGASEATSIGNLIVQAIALGELASLADARDLVARSIPTQEYAPEGDWSDVRDRFERVLRLGSAGGAVAR